jgi:hypothetical protein
VSECSQHPSNPVRGLVYGSGTADFDLCVRHLQMLGVRYYMAWTPGMQRLASNSSQLTLVKDIPQKPPLAGPPPDKELKNWKVYQVANSDLVVGMDREPVVVTSLQGGRPKYSRCWDQAWDPASGDEPRMQDGWECTTAPWWVNREVLGTAYAQTGPSEWARVDANDLAQAKPRVVTPPKVSNVRETVDKISFDVSEIGKPVEVKTSYFPNWHVSGAKGPYRLAPNLMVVVPTSTHVELTYGLTKADWAGRAITVVGAIGLVLLGLWTGARRFAAGHDGTQIGDHVAGEPSGRPGSEEPNATPEGPEPGPSEEEPPDRREPEPALP